MNEELKQLLEFIRFPSISTDINHAKDVRQCAQWLQQLLDKIGMKTEWHETKGHPIVIARYQQNPALKTVMIYGHYDVQPADPLSLWENPPFDPVIQDGKIWARGATDNKGQMFAHIMGVAKTLKEKGSLPVNLIFLFEGEEEIGSPNLAPFLQTHAHELTCDVIAISDTGMVAPNTPTMSYGLRGIACCEVIVKGPSKDLHSGVFGGAIMNPATAIAQLVASLHHKDGSVAVEGFYHDVKPLELWEREMWQGISSVNESEFLTLTGAPALAGETGYTSAERTWARPSAEVNGIGGGYQGEGSKTVLPAEAFAKLSFRLVPNQDPEIILQQVKKHLEKHCPTGVTIEVKIGHSGKPYFCDPYSPMAKAAQCALRQTFQDAEPVLIREGGSIPIVQSFREILGVDTLLLGLALPDAQIHSPNENFPIENFEAGIRLNQALLEHLANA